MQMSFYELLGVSVNASEADIRKNYQELARKFHPDKTADESAKETFIKLTEAWKVLGDTHRRKEYDDQLKREKLYQKFPISEELFIEDLEFDSADQLYRHACRCSGVYEFSDEAARAASEREVAVSCNNCSLAIIIILNNQESNSATT